MRGTHGNSISANHGSRLIPAHAGNTSWTPCVTGMGRAHPRACGEHDSGSLLPLAWGGSSPRMRGTPGHRDGCLDPDGLIPAHAGNTPARRGQSSGKRAHPRACGEHAKLGETTGVDEGSSPRMRGTPQAYALKENDAGLIPAHAGNTPPRRPTCVPAGAHPHACGEH